jgi:hypothetical protein
MGTLIQSKSIDVSDELFLKDRGLAYGRSLIELLNLLQFDLRVFSFRDLVLEFRLFLLVVVCISLDESTPKYLSHKSDSCFPTFLAPLVISCLCHHFLVKCSNMVAHFVLSFYSLLIDNMISTDFSGCYLSLSKFFSKVSKRAPRVVYPLSPIYLPNLFQLHHEIFWTSFC